MCGPSTWSPSTRPTLEDCMILMTDGVNVIAAAEPAEDVVARLEAEAREEDEAAEVIKERNAHGHVTNRD